MSDELTPTVPYAIALTVAYDGAPFAGFARQPGLDTVQGRLETALATVLRRPVMTVGAGRTDAGVHALGQIVSFDGRGDEPDAPRLRRSIDAVAGTGLVVREVRLARAGFSARFDAVSREYRYRIVIGAVPPLFLGRFAWHVATELDREAMASAARLLVGEHDFRSFCVTESGEGQRTVRHIDLIDVGVEEHLGESCLVVRVRGNAFLHSMVRVIVGTLVEVGARRREPSWVGEVLQARARCRGPYSSSPRAHALGSPVSGGRLAAVTCGKV